jgi:hypothetical protein
VCGAGADLVRALDGVREVPEPASRYPDFAAVERRNSVLREAMTQIIRAWPSGAALSTARRAIRTRIRDHLDRHVERASR